MKKSTKILTNIGAVSLALAPVAITLSCSGDKAGRYEGPNDKVIKILTDYKNQAGKPNLQWKALKKQVDSYNSTEKSKNGGYEVQLVRQYPVPPFLAQTYQAQDKNKIVNMAITYPDSLGLVTKYDMQLNLNSATTEKEQATTTKIDLSNLFSDDYVSINNKIGGLKTGGTYAIPITKSTDMNAINELVIGYLLAEGGFSVDTKTNAPKLNSYLDKYNANKSAVKGNITQDEFNKLATSFPKNNPVVAASTTKYDDSIFTDGSKLLDFVIEAGRIFNIKDEGKSFVLGIDSATNFVYNSINSLVNAKPEDFAFAKKDDGYIKYQFKSTKIKTAFTSIWNKLKEAIDLGALFFAGTVDGNKEYGSNYLSANSMGMSIGSTAGYNYLSKDPSKSSKDGKSYKDLLNPTELDVATPPATFGSGNGIAKSVLVQGPSLISLHVNKEEDEATAKFIKWFIGDGKSTSPLGTFTAEANYIAPTKEVLGGTADPSWNDGLRTAFNLLKAVGTDPNVHGFDNPVDNTTGEIRKVIQDAIHLQYSQHKTNKKEAVTIDGLYDEISKKFKEGTFK